MEIGPGLNRDVFERRAMRGIALLFLGYIVEK